MAHHSENCVSCIYSCNNFQMFLYVLQCLTSDFKTLTGKPLVS